MTIEDKLKVVGIVLSLFITVLYIIQSSKLEEEKNRAKQAEERLSKSIEEIEEYIEGEKEEDKNYDAEDARRYGMGLYFPYSIRSEALNALIEVIASREGLKGNVKPANIIIALTVMSIEQRKKSKVGGC